ncbi:MAG: cell cycle transcriptional regulator TrcR [Pseudomonadota bacterium]|mgnify:FL=1
MADILMPKATAVWLIDNTTLTFDQIADLCGLHHLEVKGIADGDVAENMRGVDPISGGELTREEIQKGEEDPAYRLKTAPSKIAHIPQPKRKGARYTPVARRGDKPDAIAWFIRNHPEVTDPQISKLIGTTKATITNVRDKTHWNSQNIKPVDPVTLGLCSQIELDEVITKASSRRKEMDAERAAQEEGPGLNPAEAVETIEAPTEPAPSAEEPSAEDVFSAFKD